MKRIMRFNESEQIDISPERTAEIIDDLKDLVATLGEKKKLADSLISELDAYKNKSDRGNDQIDDTIAALQVISKDLETSADKTDTAIGNLESYGEEGRKYLYSENK
jgi:ABC-type transporter Mla subunit MlaD